MVRPQRALTPSFRADLWEPSTQRGRGAWVEPGGKGGQREGSWKVLGSDSREESLGKELRKSKVSLGGEAQFISP